MITPQYFMKNQLLLTTLLFLACSNSEEKENPTLNYTILKSFDIPIDEDMQYAHSQILLVDNGLFVGLDQNFSKLDFFNFKSKILNDCSIPLNQFSGGFINDKLFFRINLKVTMLST